MGTTVTCPTLRYNPAVVAEAFATMSHLYPNRVFPGVGSGEALAAGKNPADMPVLVEQYVVVGDQKAAEQAGEFWRFGPKAFKTLYNAPSPVEIQKQAEDGTPMKEVLKSRAIGTSPEVHIEKMHELFESGATIVNVHSGQPDQARVIDFYGSHVLPKVRVG